MSNFKKLFKSTKPIIGVIHLASLPGTPQQRYSLEEIIEGAVQDGESLFKGGIDGIIIENYGDYPFFPESVEPHTVAAMSRITLAVKEVVSDIPLGINVLRNDARSALAIAAMTDCQFIRVNVHTGAMLTDQGILQGQAHQTLRYRTQLKSDVAIFADILVKHAVPLGSPDLVSLAKDTFSRGMADGLIVTGSGTGNSTNLADVERIKSAQPDLPLLVGSGVTLETITETLAVSDGVIVGTALKKEGITENPVDVERVRKLIITAS